MGTLDQAVGYLDSHINRAVTLDKIDESALDAMRSLMEALGDPQLDIPVIQITGTNGKGSTAAMISSLLTALGLNVGLYGSPHVSSITERMQLGGTPISEEDFVDLVEVLRTVEATLDFTPAWFELMTAAAYRWFADQAVDVAVVEVGMFGRFDATSVVQPEVAVVTNVGFDHTDGREGWRRDIAWEKAGIIKPGSVLVLGERDPELEEIFISEGPSRILRRDDDFDCLDNVLAVGGRVIGLRTPLGLYEEVFVSLHGAHQGDNAAVALTAAEAFVGAALSDEVVEEGFGTLALPGRFEILQQEPLVVLDGAHNPQGAEAAVATLDDGFTAGGRRILVVGMMQDKDAEWMLEALGAENADLLICTEALIPRAMNAAELAAVASTQGYEVEAVADPAQAVARALAVAAPEDVILGAGSLYVVGALRDAYLQMAPPSSNEPA
ncbi:MAG: bifunctional folylpolyglutamate synthase/dihydrofolate synthase [Acidimicrobiales bacterium]